MDAPLSDLTARDHIGARVEEWTGEDSCVALAAPDQYEVWAAITSGRSAGGTPVTLPGPSGWSTGSLTPGHSGSTNGSQICSASEEPLAGCAAPEASTRCAGAAEPRGSLRKVRRAKTPFDAW